MREPYLADPDVTLWQGDCLEVLRELPGRSVDMIATSPPFFGLRDYGTGTWEGGDPNHEHDRKPARNGRGGSGAPGKQTAGAFPDDVPVDECSCGAVYRDSQIGLEETPDEWVARLVAVFAECRRVLADHGTLWVEIGSSFVSSGDTPANPSLQPPNARPYGNDDKAPQDSLAPDCVYRDLCDGCLADYSTHLLRTADNDPLRAPSPPLVAQTDRDSEPGDSDEATAAAVLPDVPPSTTLASWLARRGECSDCDNRAASADLAETHSVSRDAHSSAHSSACTTDTVRLSPTSGGRNEGKEPSGLAWGDYISTLGPKNLLPQPWMLAMSLQMDGWILRSEIVWSKSNPMPESVTDRPTKSHSTVFLLSKQPRYFYDQHAIREPFVSERGSGNKVAKGPADRGADLGKGATASSIPWQPPRTVPQIETLDGSEGDTPRGADGRRVTVAVGKENSEQHRNGERWPNPDGANARSVWVIPTESTPFAHFACVDDQTEALTPHGWRRHDDLTNGENIAVYDPATDTCRFEPAQFHRYDYDAELVAIDKRDTSQRLTPNHRCYVRQRNGEVGIVEAADLRADMDLLVSAPLEPWNERDPDVAFARVLGWYVAEGSNVSPGHVAIYQSDTANPDKVAAIREALRACAAEFRESRRDRVSASFSDHTEVRFSVRGVLARQLQAHGKILLTEDLCRSDEAARALLDALIDGDGHRRKDGRACIVQKDRDSIDAMQALALRCGYRAHISQRKDGMYVLYLTDGRWLTLRGTNGTLVTPGREHYTGTVWCPEVSTGLWLARRAGKPFVTGNTWPKALVRKMILAGTSDVGICPVCRAPWTRQVEAEGGSIGRDWNKRRDDGKDDLAKGHSARRETMDGTYRRRITGWEPTCAHGEQPVPAVVLDPFAGSGTTLLVARQLGRHAVGIELNPEYLKLASNERLAQQSLFA